MTSPNAFPFTWPVDVAHKPGVTEALAHMAQAWDVARRHLNPRDYSLEKDVLSLFVRQALHCTTDRVAQAANGSWVDVQPGTLRPGDVVRVKADAYTGDAGAIHNSRVGEVLWVEHGDVVVASRDGKQPFLSGAHYSPHDLQTLISDDADGWRGKHHD